MDMLPLIKNIFFAAGIIFFLWYVSSEENKYFSHSTNYKFYFRIDNGSNPGELVGKVKREKGVITYLYQYATDAMLAQDNWQSVPCSKSSCIITDLQPGTKYNCRVAAIGPREQIMYSDTVARIVA